MKTLAKNRKFKRIGTIAELRGKKAVKPKKVENLEELLSQVGMTDNDNGKVTLAMIVQQVGSRSFGPLLLLIGVLLTSPLSGIPGIPTTMAVFLIMIAFQLLKGKKYFWLPAWVLKLSIPKTKIARTIRLLNPPARFIDHLIQPRLHVFVNGTGTYIIAVICCIIALLLPIMEIIPFSATTAGIILSFFGLSLVSKDGFLLLVAYSITIIIAGLIIYGLITAV